MSRAIVVVQPTATAAGAAAAAGEAAAGAAAGAAEAGAAAVEVSQTRRLLLRSSLYCTSVRDVEDDSLHGQTIIGSSSVSTY